MTSQAIRAVPTVRAVERQGLVTWLLPLGLFGLALLVRLWAAGEVPFPANEGSASYVGVSRNLAEGRGLVSDALWSYASPPLSLPKPAFEIWMPMASFLAALPMVVLGTSFAAAQLSSVLLGALVAPLVWTVAREAGARAGLPSDRGAMLALSSGLVAAAFGPFLVAAAVPDSTTPFLVFSLAACLIMARMVAQPRRRTGLLSGILLGLAYLSRQDALYLGLAYLVLVWGATSDPSFATRLRGSVRLVAPVIAGGLLVVSPWLARNLATFGTLFGQTIETAFLQTNEQIFAYIERPTAAAYLAQGPWAILSSQVGAVAHNLVEVLLLPAMPVGFLGMAAILVLRRSPALRGPTALQALLLSGFITFAVTSLVFPVATLWGTFLHASGPLLAALLVIALLGLDAAVRWAGQRRGWARANLWLGPVAILSLVVPFSVLQVSAVSSQARVDAARMAAAAAAVEHLPELATAPRAGDAPRMRAALISDRAVWLAEALRRPVIALPDEHPRAVGQLAADFGTRLVVMLDVRGRYPAVWLTPEGLACLAGPPQPLLGPADPALVARLRPDCVLP